MRLDEECKDCLYRSQLNKVKRECADMALYEQFRTGVKAMCENPPEDYCAPLLARDINRLHARIFGHTIDYAREKKLFNSKLSEYEEELFSVICSFDDPLKEAIKYAMASNYIDFARLCDLKEDAIEYVIDSAKRAAVDLKTLESLKKKLAGARTLLYLHDNCGEIVLDKILIRVIKKLYPSIAVISAVRGAPVINDATVEDALSIGLDKYARVVDNGSDVAGTYLEEITPELFKLLKQSDVIISKGLGNLETLYGEISAFYLFCCKCGHISAQFGAPLWASVFTEA